VGSRGTEFAGSRRFEVVARLGGGAMGEVFEAVDRERNARVALKQLHARDAEALLRFKTGFRAMEDVVHPNLLGLSELIEEDGAWFITMELIEGVDFLTWVRPGTAPAIAQLSTIDLLGVPVQAAADAAPAAAGGVLDEGRLRGALRQLASAVDALHSAGKVHRDIKPSNILVGPDGRLTLIDLGLVSDFVRPAAPHGLAGTAAYIAPEQLDGGGVAPAADWYSVGVLLYQALTGRLPFDGPPLEVMRRKREGEPPRAGSVAAGVPADLDQLCGRLLHRDPAARPAGPEILHLLAAPARGEAAAAPAFVGRGRELQLVAEGYAAMIAGTATTLLIEGESGVGKSALVARALQSLSLDALVLAGRCHERESVPYKAFDDVIDAVHQHLLTLPEGERAALLAGDAAILAQVFPVLRALAPRAATPLPEPARAERHGLREQLYAGMRGLLGRMGARRPLVVVIDDLQWADADSRTLLVELLRPPAPRMLLLAIARSGAGAPPELPGRVTHLWLHGLPPAEADALADEVARRLGGPAPPQLGRVAGETAGHPLFIAELVRHACAHPDGALTGLSLDQALWTRIRALPVGPRRLIEIVALAGVPVRQDVAGFAAEAGDAAELGRWIAVLRGAHLARTSGARDADTIEPYHDRVREALLEKMPAELRSRGHRRLAVALERLPGGDAETAAIHWLGAGEPLLAAAHAAAAAVEAFEALAFQRAARLYRQAIDLGQPEGEVRGALLAQLGDALTNAGLSAQAAVAYAEAADASAGPGALDLRRRAGEEYLRSGLVDEGLAVMGQVLAPLGMRMAATPRRALLSLLATRARVRLRGLGVRERDAADIEPTELMRIDTCWAVAAGLGMVDPFRGADFQARQLLLALDCGEPFRICRALAAEAAYRTTAGVAAERRARPLLDRAEAIAETLTDPRGRGLCRFARGLGALLGGRWREAGARLEESTAVFRDQCVGMNWELHTSQYYALVARLWTGDLVEVARRLPAMRGEAERRGDLYAHATLHNGLIALHRLASDQPDVARAESQEVVERLGRFQFQHYWAMLTRAFADLYEGRGPEALAGLEESWPQSVRALFLHIQYIRVEAEWLRARCLIAAACAASGDARRTLVRRAARVARRLAGERLPWADPMAAATRAAIAWIEGDLDGARAGLEGAAAGFAAADMPLPAAAVRARLGRLLDGDAGAALVAAAEAEVRACGVVAPGPMIRLYVPAPDA
jgi:hypothetical protein